MTTSTLGSNSTTSLPFAMIFSGAMPAADVATVQQAIKDDQNVARPVWPGAWSSHDLLYIPNRGVIRALPGDWIAVDSRGWPILLSADTIANGLWTHTP